MGIVEKLNQAFEMDFIDWCTKILSVLVEASNKSPYARTSGLDTVRLFHALFDEDTQWDSLQHSAMNSALRALEDLGFVEDVRSNHPKITRLGRELVLDFKPYWKEICSIKLTSELQYILSTVNRLSQKIGDDYVALEDVHHTVLLPEIGGESAAELGEGGMIDSLWASSVDLDELGLIERDERMGGHLILTATYKGLVWETRCRLFQICDVFISHITEESAAAIRLKDLLIKAFGNDLKVFISSDYRSIGGGKVWYAEIIESLMAAPVVLALLSRASVSRPWINFEAGVGIGSGSLVIPLVAADLRKSDVGFPLAALQIRSINDPKDVEGVVRDISQRTGRAAASIDVTEFITEESADGASKLGVTLHQVTERVYEGYEERKLRLNLINNSSKTINDYRIDVEVPNAFLNQSTGYAAEVENRRTSAYRVFRMESKDSGIKTLRPGDIAKSFFSITLVIPPGASEGDALDQKIIIKVFDGDIITQVIERPVREILEMPPSFG